MKYPKPLKPQTIEKRFANSGLSKEKIDFLHDFFQSASNLYGMIKFDLLLDVLVNFLNKHVEYPRLAPEEIGTFIEIARREELPYHLYNYSEFFAVNPSKAKEPNTMSNMILMNNKLEENLYLNVYIHDWYSDNGGSSASDYFEPEDLLSYKDEVEHEYQQRTELMNILKQIKLSGVPLDQATDNYRSFNTDISVAEKFIKDLVINYNTNGIDGIDTTLSNFLFMNLDLGKITFDDIFKATENYINSKPSWFYHGYSYNQIDDTVSYNDRKRKVLEQEDDLREAMDMIIDLSLSYENPPRHVTKIKYPKYLLDKTIKNRYKKAGLFSEEKLNFLHEFFLACANLYGAIEIDEMIYIYERLKEKVDCPEIDSNEFFTFAGIVRREDVPYFVYEGDELYPDGLETDILGEYYIVNKDALNYEEKNISQLAPVYNIIETDPSYDYYIPDNLLNYASALKSKEELDLRAFFTSLGSKSDHIDLSKGQLVNQVMQHINICVKANLSMLNPLDSESFIKLIGSNYDFSEEEINKLNKLLNNYIAHLRRYTLKGYTVREFEAVKARPIGMNDIDINNKGNHLTLIDNHRDND